MEQVDRVQRSSLRALDSSNLRHELKKNSWYPILPSEMGTMMMTQSEEQRTMTCGNETIHIAEREKPNISESFVKRVFEGVSCTSQSVFLRTHPSIYRVST
jgi:hypothetical protein